MAAQEATARWTNSVKVSTLVLINDAEYDLEVSTGHLTLANWGQHGEPTKKTFTLSLVPRENENGDGDEDISIPLVITVPFTQQFKLSGPAALTSPFMPLLESRCPLEYTVEFARPQVTESDYVWDNFQDQVVIQTRLSKLVIKLQAIKESSPSDFQFTDTFDAASLFPRSLPEIKVPSLKLFKYIEKNHRVASTETVMTRRPERVSESFNCSKKTAESALAPLRPRSPADKQPVSLPVITSSRPSSSERTTTPPMSESTSTKVDLPTVSTAAEVNNQMEAKAIILRLRARNSTRIGTNSLLSSLGRGYELSPEEPFPESRLDAKTKAELDEFNHLVVSVKEGVKRDEASAKSELDYYRQFLPRAPSDTLMSRHSTPRETMVAPSTLKPLWPISPADHSSISASIVSTATPSVSAIRAKRVKPLPVSKAPARLPTLSALSSSPHTVSVSPNSSSPSLEVETNQETSPVRVSTVSGPVAAEKKPKDQCHRTQSTRLAPQPPHKLAAGTATTKNSGSAVRTKAGGPSEIKSASQATQQQIETRANAKKQHEPLVKKPATSKRKTNQQLPKAKMRDPETALSDFDDPDPEIDDAPLLPDDLGGMRASYACGDDDDEY